MSEKDIEQLKKEAAAKAKAAALAKQQRMSKEGAAETEETSSGEEKAKALAKAKAAAAAKAKAAALAKQQRMSKEGAAETEGTSSEEEKVKALAKAKAAAAAKAKAAALAKQQRVSKEKVETEETSSEEEKAKALARAKAVAAAKAKAATMAKKTTKVDKNETSEPELPNQPLLDHFAKIIQNYLGDSALEEYYINKLSKYVPTIVVNQDYYYRTAQLLKVDENLQFDYLSELHGTDFETHMEVYVFLYSFVKAHSIVLKVKINRDDPVLPSLAPLWEGANWPECEAYDLLGIKFKNHPNLKRLLLGEEWVGYPLRKDYEPYDVEV